MSWDRDLWWVLAGYRFAKQAALKNLSPYHLLYGRDPVVPIDAPKLLYAIIEADEPNLWAKLAHKRAKYLKELTRAALNNLHVAQLRDTSRYQQRKAAGMGGKGDKVVAGQEVYLRKAKHDTLDLAVGTERWKVKEVRDSGVTSGMGLVLGGRGPVVLTSHVETSWVDDSATQWSSQGYTFSLGSGSVSWRSTRSSSVLSSSCEAEIYAGAMAAQELHWLTYLLTDLGEQPHSPPVLYVEKKAMIALCQEHRLEHKTKHIALRYFLARDLEQRGQLRLAHVAIRANSADIFTKALPPGDHQRFSTVLGLVPTLPHLLTA
ncbi:unnamed protein product [Closterium sp. NIES-53]